MNALRGRPVRLRASSVSTAPAGAADGSRDRAQGLPVRRPGGEEAPQAEVLLAVEQQGQRGLAVTTGASDLLVVRVQRLRDVGVNHEPHVRLVDAHAEGRRRDHDIQLVPEELLVHPLAVGRAQPTVVRRGAHPPRREGLLVPPGVLAGGDVHQARPLLLLHLLHHGTTLAVVVDEPLHHQLDVGSVEPLDDLQRVREAQPLDDLGAHRCRRRRGQGHDRGVPQPLDRVTDPQVVGAEVVSPGGDAVRLVHHQQRRGDLRELLEDLLLGELLGGEEQVLRPPGVDLLPRGPHLSGRRRRVHRHGPGYVGRGQCRRLVVLEREQRRDHDRGAVDDQGGDLVDRGLSRARGHHGQHVAAGDERLDRLGLAGPELVPAEAVARQALEVPSSLRRHLQQVPRRTVAIRPAGVVLDRVLP